MDHPYVTKCATWQVKNVRTSVELAQETPPRSEDPALDPSSRLTRLSGWPSTPRILNIFWSALLICVTALSVVGCSGPEPVRLGFVAHLSGLGAELGQQERNGAQLAVKTINAAGGVNGRPIDLIIKDDLGTPEGAQAADRELIRDGVVAIIGHATSEETLAGLTVTNPAHMVMLSPTASASELRGRDDYFFRVVTSLLAPQQFAEHIFTARHHQRLAAIYDTDNSAYSKAYLKAFLGKYQPLGGVIAVEASFSSKAQPDFAPMIGRLRASRPEGLLIIASGIDTALIAQRVRLTDWTIPMFTTAWAQTQTLIDHGGKAVEGMEVEYSTAMASQTPRYLDFQARYRARFGMAPSFGAVFSHDAVEVLTLALRRTGDTAEGLKPSLLGIKGFQGLGDTLSFDRYGDALRPICFGVIQDGEYVPITA